MFGLAAEIVVLFVFGFAAAEVVIIIGIETIETGYRLWASFM